MFRRGPLEQLLLRATAGRPYTGLRAKITPLHTSYAAPSTRSAVRHGVRLELDLSDLIDWYVYWGFSDPSHDSIVARCRPGQTVIDVGANRGATALPFARAVGPSGRVIALEPDQRNFEILRERAESNGLGWLTPLRRAVSDAAGAVRLTPRDPRNSGMHQIAAEGVEVRACAVDDVAAELGLDRVDLIKIDVEGYEPNVLRGAVRTLDAHRPEIVLEVDDENLAAFGSSAGKLLGFLSELDYEICDVTTGGAPPSRGHFDALATPTQR